MVVTLGRGALVPLLVQAWLGIAAAQGQLPKHVIMFVIDDLGFADMSYKGQMYNMTEFPLFPTPNLDRLAFGGVRLESTYVHYLCSPSRMAFLSGRYAYNLGGNTGVIVNGQPDQLPTNVKTTADLLQAHGWSTAAFGKWDLGQTTWGCTPNCRGFQHFSGFYDAYNDYFTHMPTPQGFDLRHDFAVDTANNNQTGVYMTHLITARVIDWINSTVASNGQAAPSFAYVAHQAIHAPQQVPASYLSGFCLDNIPADQPTRRMACGQMRAVDESVGMVVAAYQALGIWNDTFVILTADNGGNTDTGGNNWPLRGMKATLFEGGMRAASFVHGAGLQPAVAGTVNHEFYSLVDWMPTIVEGIAQINISEALEPKHSFQPAPPPVDGVNIWASITTGAPSPRSEALLNLAPTPCFAGKPVNGSAPPCDIPGAGAYRMGPWKLIHGHVGEYAGPVNTTTAYCGPRDGNAGVKSFPLNITLATTPAFCPAGWVPPPGSAGMPAAIPPPDINCSSIPCMLWETPYIRGGTWLFNVVDDPTEQTDLASQHPDIVATLMAKLQAYNATNVPQHNDPIDPASDPANFGGVWTPWQGDPIPEHCDPNATNAVAATRAWSSNSERIRVD